MCCGSEHQAHFKGNAMPDFGRPLSSIIRGMMSHMQHGWRSFEGWVPHYTEEYKDYYRIMVPLPGFSKKHLEVNLISDNLNIKAKREGNDIDEKVREKKPEKLDRNQIIKEIFTNLWENGVNLDIKLPSNVNTDEITSKMADGLLQIKVSKKEPKTINIDEERNDFK